MGMAQDNAIQEAVDRNYEAFKALLPDLIKTHLGKYALLREQAVVETFDTAGDAMKFAEAQFSDGLFSIQKITAQVVDLGYFSHAMHVGDVQSTGGATP